MSAACSPSSLRSGVWQIALIVAALITSRVVAQGPTSRGVTSLGAMPSGEYAAAAGEREEIPFPDMFRTEGAFVERNLRTDYIFRNHLHEPAADESEFFTEFAYSFTERLGFIFAAPYVSRDNFDNSSDSGFGDIEAGVRYVAVGADQESLFKLAFGFNALAPTGDEERDLGEGQSILEPELLMFFKLTDSVYAQTQFSWGLPTESGGTTEFEYNSGVGRVFADFPHTELFAYPTAIVEVNGFAGVGGAESATSIVDLTSGLRWSVGRKMFAGFGASVPVTNDREFETQFLFSLIYRYGVEPGVAVPSASGSPTSRAYF